MFCPYFRDVLREKYDLEKYFNALFKEIEMYGKFLEGRNLNVVEIHVGGGTPSLVPPKFYKELAIHLEQFFNVRCGIGIEVNPEDFVRYEDVEGLSEAGVDEVSIGVQSFNVRILRSIGRKHSPEDSVKAIENSLKAGFKWINVDLMFLTPNIKGYVELTLEEKLKAFKEDIERSYELGVHQITFYSTVIPMQSPGHKLIKHGKLSQELDFLDLFIDKALDFIEDRHLYLTRVYSASRKRYEYTTVNLEMVGPLIGFGASSWSNTGLYQYINIHNILDYVDLTKSGIIPAIYTHET